MVKNFVKNRVSLNHIVAEWEEILKDEKNYSSNTAKSYLDDIVIFQQFITKNYNNTDNILQLLLEMEIKDFRSFIKYIREKRGVNSTVRAISAVRNLFNFVDKNYSAKNPYISSLRAPKKDKNLPRAISEEHITSLRLKDSAHDMLELCDILSSQVLDKIKGIKTEVEKDEKNNNFSSE